jgi:hypothetical protein
VADEHHLVAGLGDEERDPRGEPGIGRRDGDAQRAHGHHVWAMVV